MTDAQFTIIMLYLSCAATKNSSSYKKLSSNWQAGAEVVGYAFTVLSYFMIKYLFAFVGL